MNTKILIQQNENGIHTQFLFYSRFFFLSLWTKFTFYFRPQFNYRIWYGMTNEKKNCRINRKVYKKNSSLMSRMGRWYFPFWAHYLSSIKLKDGMKSVLEGEATNSLIEIDCLSAQSNVSHSKFNIFSLVSLLHSSIHPRGNKFHKLLLIFVQICSSI